MTMTFDEMFIEEEKETEKRLQEIGFRWKKYRVTKTRYVPFPHDQVLKEECKLQYFNKKLNTWIDIPVEPDYHYV